MTDPLLFPIGSVMRIAKPALGPGVTVSQEVKANLSRATGTFLSYLAFLAEEHAASRKKSTLSTEDILYALEELDIPDVYDGAVDFLESLREKGEEKRQARKAASSLGSNESGTDVLTKQAQAENLGDEEEEEEGDGDGDRLEDAYASETGFGRDDE